MSANSNTPVETKYLQEESIEIRVWDKTNNKYKPTKLIIGKEPDIRDYIKN